MRDDCDGDAGEAGELVLLTVAPVKEAEDTEAEGVEVASAPGTVIKKVSKTVTVARPSDVGVLAVPATATDDVTTGADDEAGSSDATATEVEDTGGGNGPVGDALLATIELKVASGRSELILSRRKCRYGKACGMVSATRYSRSRMS